MPLEGFICPDRQRINKEECFQKCRMEEECLTIPTLMAIAYEREWKGKPSTTQLLNGPMMNVLKVNKPYYVRPENRVFALEGTWMHSRLEHFAKPAKLVAEYKLGGEITGICDLLEPDRRNGGYILTDYKLWGSYQVMKAIRDKDLSDEMLQLNHYRIMVEQSKPLAKILGQEVKISRMRLQVIVRDGNTKSAEINGVRTTCKMIPIDRVEDDKLLPWFHKRRDELILAMDEYAQDGKLPRLCDARECWDGRRCKGNCDVAEYCARGLRHTRTTK